MTRTTMWSVTALTLAVTATIALAPGASAATPKSGSYAGIGTEELKVGLRVSDGLITPFVFSGPIGQCGTNGGFYSLEVTEEGRFLGHRSGDGSDEKVRGRFVSPSRVRGTFTDTESDLSPCPGTYRRKFVLERFGKGGDGQSSDPASGHYAGAGRNAFVWFDVKAGQVKPDSYVTANFPNCTDRTQGLAEGSAVGPTGHFSIYESDPPDAEVLSGRFTSQTEVRGALYWNTPYDCPSGTTKFPYTAKRFVTP
jgi:hypothetical protein